MDPIRTQLLAYLEGGHAHAEFRDAIRNFPAEARDQKPEAAPHTAWQLLEHLRIAQYDILDFCRNPNYKAHKWPEAYWPATAAPPSADAWDHSVAAFENDFKTFTELIADPAQDLFAPFPHGDGQTLFREALLIIDHNAYHVGQLVTLRSLLGIWPPA